MVNKELEEIRWGHEVLQQKYNQVRESLEEWRKTKSTVISSLVQVSKEREEIQERFSTAILEIQQKAGLK